MRVAAIAVALLFQQTAPTFLESIEVRVTNLDVVVTDRAGKPVTGLRSDDFTVLENGAPQTITNFAEFRGTRGVAEAVASTETSAAPAPVTAEAPPPRKFIFFIDTMSLTDSNSKQLVKSATELVRTEMRAGDEAMVVTRTNEVEPFTSDRDLIVKRLADTLARESRFRADTAYRQEELFLRSLRASSGDEFKHVARIYATRVNRRVTSTLRTLLGLVGSLNQTSGRKVLVVMSESLSSEPGREAFGLMAILESLEPTPQAFSGMASGGMESDIFRPAETAAHASWYDVRPMIKELAARASANGVTIYTLQPDFAGAVAVPGGSADLRAPIGAPTRRGGQDARGGTFAVTQFHRTVVEGTRDTLGTLADDTGGKMFIGARELPGGFRQIAEDLTSYYSLGYRSADSGGNIKKIDVRVKNHPDYVVRSRRELLRRTPEREMDEIVAANLIVPRHVNELGIVASAGKLERQLPDAWRVPVVVKIPMSKLTFIPDGEKYRGLFTVHYAIADGAGYTTGTYREQALEIPAREIDAARAQFYTFSSTLIVAPGTVRIAVGVYDRYSHLAGFEQVEVNAR
ncbi:MAG TPA: VWA domain-containing protein [Thermoanaerobaculia bacterium]|nr:VWA domain-containing protein [Thermoanaerobaculia bacterium]